MLSDRERRELATIERGLADEDPGFVDAFRERRSASGRRGRHWPSRLLVGFGVLLLVVGILAGAEGLVLQGLLLGAAGVGWSRWRVRRSADGPPGLGRLPWPRPEPGTPPKWRRPF